MCRSEEVGVGEGRALEREANVFAAELLMPEGAVRSEATRVDIAQHFGVSAEAMGWRLYNFGLCDEVPISD
jgi:Zn-dependent peptidase ImmA (M78 family)